VDNEKAPAPAVKPGLVNQVTTTAGSRTSIVLPDGTKVWLNSCSSLRYEGELLNGRREVTLTGEAFFEVKHDEQHPFIIHTRNFDVMDLGTVFNVRAYPEDAMAEAALISGSIEVSMKNGSEDKIVLRPHEKITVYNDHEYSRDTIAMGLHVSRRANIPVSKESQVTPIVTDPEYKMAVDTAWMANKLIFTNEAFADLALQMERRYGVKVYFENEKASRYKFTGRFEDESIDQALEELQAIASFRYKKMKNQIFISK
jgi:ferric-dicitrate binding protein FerR (iron transport regulator)